MVIFLYLAVCQTSKTIFSFIVNQRIFCFLYVNFLHKVLLDVKTHRQEILFDINLKKYMS